jgi:hypothetical protein
MSFGFPMVIPVMTKGAEVGFHGFMNHVPCRSLDSFYR